MYSTVLSGGIHGIHGFLVQVEVDISQGLPGFELVGFLSSEVKEARERVKVALKNNHFPLPPSKVTINLSPAHIRKDGTAYDLPIAVGILECTGYLRQGLGKEILILGELGLNGELRPVRGILPIAQMAKAQGIQKLLIPKANEKEGAVVEGLSVYGMETLADAISFLQDMDNPKWVPAKVDLQALFSGRDEGGPDFAEIKGQELLKRGAVIAAAGFHHMLLIGPPGSGKTMLAKRIPSILPDMTLEEALEVSTIYSVAGLLMNGQYLVSKRPFLDPHHTVTMSALTGGGAVPRPGIVSLAHRGVLFLDELTEFRKETIEILRQPIEDKQVHVARSGGNFIYPANTLVIAACNPCPCGYYPDTNKCSCTASQIRQYLGKISGPILDRMDLILEAPKVEIQSLQDNHGGLSSGELYARVERARKMQEKRFAGTDLHFNAEMGPAHIRKYCPLDAEVEAQAKLLFEAFDLSARSYHKMLKVSRTLADLEGSDKILPKHLAEAICYRQIPLGKEDDFV